MLKSRFNVLSRAKACASEGGPIEGDRVSGFDSIFSEMSEVNLEIRMSVSGMKFSVECQPTLVSF